MWQYNYCDPNELYHHGVLGMKWGHRKAQRYQQTLSDASKQASKFAGYAKEDIKKFGDMGDKRSQAISKKQLTRYEKMSKDWANTKVKDIDRKKIKEAKNLWKKDFLPLQILLIIRIREKSIIRRIIKCGHIQPMMSFTTTEFLE